MMPRFLQSAPAAILFCASAIAAETASVASGPDASWRCVAAGAGEAVSLLPAVKLGAVVNRFAGLYSTRVLGLVQSKDRVYLLGTGNLGSRAGLRADVVSVGPADREFVAQRHVFRIVPGLQGKQSAAGGYICLADAEAGRHGLTFAEQGDVTLGAGKSVSLFDPSDPSVRVELRAADFSAMSLRGTTALSGRLGIYAGLMRQHGQPAANIAIEDAGGRIVFKAVPDALPQGAGMSASRGRIDLTVSDASAASLPAAGVEEVALAERPALPQTVTPAGTGGRVAATTAANGGKPVTAGTAPQSPSVAEAPAKEAPPVIAQLAVQREPPVEAGTPGTGKEALVEASPVAVAPVVHAPSSGPDGARDDDASYASALRKLMERQGTGSVRSVSELTRVHPAVDALRAALR